MKILDLLISQTIPIIIAGVIMTRCFLNMLLISQKDNHTGQFSPFETAQYIFVDTCLLADPTLFLPF